MEDLTIDDNIQTGIITNKRMEPLLKYLLKEDITDVDWNGRDLVIRTIYRENIKVDKKEHNINPEFIENFTQHVANSVSKHFNKSTPKLDAKVGLYRIRAIHQSAAPLGTCLFIRKTTTVPRLSYSKIIKQGYCTENILNFLINCYYAKINMMIAGEPGLGKTEFGKFFSLFSPNDERVVLIEEEQEWHLADLKPDGDIVEFVVSKNFTYDEALESTLRMGTKRVMIPEVKDIEVMPLLKCWMQGAKGITSTHTDDVRKIPDRLLSLMPTREDAERKKNSVYECLEIGILLSEKIDENENKKRVVEQLCIFYRDVDLGKNKTHMIIEDCRVIDDTIPEFIKKKLYDKNIINPYELYEPLWNIVNHYEEGADEEEH